MIQEILQKPLRFWFRMSLVLLLIGAAGYVLPLMAPFIIALVLTLLLWPLVNRIESLGNKYMGRYVTFPRWLAIGISFFIFGCMVTILVVYIFIPFTAQLVRLLDNFPVLVSRLVDVVAFVQIHYLNDNIPPQILAIVNSTILRVGNYSVDIAQQVIQTVLHIASFMLELLLVPILTFYLLKDGKYLVDSGLRLFSEDTRSILERMVERLFRTLSSYVRAEVFLAVNMFCIVFIGLTLFDIPYTLVLALMAAIAEWIPIIGPILGAIPAILLASLMSLSLAVRVAIFYAIVQLIDGQVIMPKVFGSFIRLHPIVIISSIFIAGILYGVKGMMLAVPSMAILQIIAKELWFYKKP